MPSLDAVTIVAENLVQQPAADHLLAVVLDQAVLTLGAQIAHVMLEGEAPGTLHLAAHRNLPNDLAATFTIVPTDAPLLACRATRTREVQVVEDVAEMDPTLSPAGELLARTGARSMLSVPMVAFERHVGVLTCVWAYPRRRTSDEMTTAITLAAMIAPALARGPCEKEHDPTILSFSTLLNAAPDAMVVVDDGGRIVLVNTQTEQVFGYARDELLGAPVEILMPERFRGMHGEHRARYARRSSTRPMGIRLELYGRRKDGAEFPVEISLSPVHTADGLLVISAIRDVSDRRRAEEEQRRLLQQAEEAEARFRGLLEAAPDAMATVDADGRVVLVNSQAERMFGYMREELVGRPVDVLLPERFRPAHVGHRNAYAQVPRVRPMGADLDLFGRRKDGSEFPVEVSLSPIRTTDGLLFTSAVRDVSQRKEMEEERERLLDQLRAERLWLHTVIDRSPVGIILVQGTDGRRVIGNRRAAKLLGRPLSEMGGIAQYAAQLHHADGTQLSLAEMPTMRALGGESVSSHELQLARPDGLRVPILASAAPIRDAHDEIVGAAVILEDVTALKDLERLREEWATVIAHDLRQPVSAISIYAGVLLDALRLGRRDVWETRGERVLEHISAAADRLERMIGDLLDSSRLEARRLELDRRDCDLPGLVAAVVDRLADVLNGRAVRAEIATTVSRVHADPGRIEQVLVNLVSNAAKYGYADTEIRIVVAPVAGGVEVSVSNHGDGIPTAELTRVFGRFRRASGAGAAGLGLGLYICKGLIEAHDGRIWAESVPGDVTTFRFTLPLAPSG